MLSCLTLCDPMDYSPPASSVHGILQARIMEWAAVPFSGSSRPRDQTQVSLFAGRFFTAWATREATQSWHWNQYYFPKVSHGGKGSMILAGLEDISIQSTFIKHLLCTRHLTRCYWRCKDSWDSPCLPVLMKVPWGYVSISFLAENNTDQG